MLRLALLLLMMPLLLLISGATSPTQATDFVGCPLPGNSRTIDARPSDGIIRLLQSNGCSIFINGGAGGMMLTSITMDGTSQSRVTVILTIQDVTFSGGSINIHPEISAPSSIIVQRCSRVDTMDAEPPGVMQGLVLFNGAVSGGAILIQACRFEGFIAASGAADTLALLYFAQPVTGPTSVAASGNHMMFTRTKQAVSDTTIPSIEAGVVRFDQAVSLSGGGQLEFSFNTLAFNVYRVATFTAFLVVFSGQLSGSSVQSGFMANLNSIRGTGVRSALIVRALWFETSVLQLGGGMTVRGLFMDVTNEFQCGVSPREIQDGEFVQVRGLYFASGDVRLVRSLSVVNSSIVVALPPMCFATLGSSAGDTETAQVNLGLVFITHPDGAARGTVELSDWMTVSDVKLDIDVPGQYTASSAQPQKMASYLFSMHLVRLNTNVRNIGSILVENIRPALLRGQHQQDPATSRNSLNITTTGRSLSYLRIAHEHSNNVSSITMRRNVLDITVFYFSPTSVDDNTFGFSMAMVENGLEGTTATSPALTVDFLFESNVFTVTVPPCPMKTPLSQKDVRAWMAFKFAASGDNKDLAYRNFVARHNQASYYGIARGTPSYYGIVGAESSVIFSRLFSIENNTVLFDSAASGEVYVAVVRFAGALKSSGSTAVSIERNKVLAPRFFTTADTAVAVTFRFSVVNFEDLVFGAAAGESIVFAHNIWDMMGFGSDEMRLPVAPSPANNWNRFILPQGHFSTANCQLRVRSFTVGQDASSSDKRLVSAKARLVQIVHNHVVLSCAEAFAFAMGNITVDAYLADFAVMVAGRGKAASSTFNVSFNSIVALRSLSFTGGTGTRDVEIFNVFLTIADYTLVHVEGNALLLSNVTTRNRQLQLEIADFNKGISNCGALQVRNNSINVTAFSSSPTSSFTILAYICRAEAFSSIDNIRINGGNLIVLDVRHNESSGLREFLAPGYNVDASTNGVVNGGLLQGSLLATIFWQESRAAAFSDVQFFEMRDAHIAVVSQLQTARIALVFAEVTSGDIGLISVTRSSIATRMQLGGGASNNFVHSLLIGEISTFSASGTVSLLQTVTVSDCSVDNKITFLQFNPSGTSTSGFAAPNFQSAALRVTGNSDLSNVDSSTSALRCSLMQVFLLPARLRFLLVGSDYKNGDRDFPTALGIIYGDVKRHPGAVVVQDSTLFVLADAIPVTVGALLCPGGVIETGPIRILNSTVNATSGGGHDPSAGRKFVILASLFNGYGSGIMSQVKEVVIADSRLDIRNVDNFNNAVTFGFAGVAYWFVLTQQIEKGVSVVRCRFSVTESRSFKVLAAVIFNNYAKDMSNLTIAETTLTTSNVEDLQMTRLMSSNGIMQNVRWVNISNNIMRSLNRSAIGENDLIYYAADGFESMERLTIVGNEGYMHVNGTSASGRSTGSVAFIFNGCAVTGKMTSSTTQTPLNMVHVEGNNITTILEGVEVGLPNTVTGASLAPIVFMTLFRTDFSLLSVGAIQTWWVNATLRFVSNSLTFKVNPASPISRIGNVLMIAFWPTLNFPFGLPPLRLLEYTANRLTVKLPRGSVLSGVQDAAESSSQVSVTVKLAATGNYHGTVGQFLVLRNWFDVQCDVLAQNAAVQAVDGGGYFGVDLLRVEDNVYDNIRIASAGFVIADLMNVWFKGDGEHVVAFLRNRMRMTISGRPPLDSVSGRIGLWLVYAKFPSVVIRSGTWEDNELHVLYNVTGPAPNGCRFTHLVHFEGANMFGALAMRRNFMNVTILQPTTNLTVLVNLRQYMIFLNTYMLGDGTDAPTTPGSVVVENNNMLAVNEAAGRHGFCLGSETLEGSMGSVIIRRNIVRSTMGPKAPAPDLVASYPNGEFWFAFTFSPSGGTRTGLTFEYSDNDVQVVNLGRHFNRAVFMNSFAMTAITSISFLRNTMSVRITSGTTIGTSGDALIGFMLEDPLQRRPVSNIGSIRFIDNVITCYHSVVTPVPSRTYAGTFAFLCAALLIDIDAIIISRNRATVTTSAEIVTAGSSSSSSLSQDHLPVFRSSLVFSLSTMQNIGSIDVSDNLIETNASLRIDDIMMRALAAGGAAALLVEADNVNDAIFAFVRMDGEVSNVTLSVKRNTARLNRHGQYGAIHLAAVSGHANTAAQRTVASIVIVIDSNVLVSRSSAQQRRIASPFALDTPAPFKTFALHASFVSDFRLSRIAITNNELIISPVAAVADGSSKRCLGIGDMAGLVFVFTEEDRTIGFSADALVVEFNTIDATSGLSYIAAVDVTQLQNSTISIKNNILSSTSATSAIASGGACNQINNSSSRASAGETLFAAAVLSLPGDALRNVTARLESNTLSVLLLTGGFSNVSINGGVRIISSTSPSSEFSTLDISVRNSKTTVVLNSSADVRSFTAVGSLWLMQLNAARGIRGRFSFSGISNTLEISRSHAAVASSSSSSTGISQVMANVAAEDEGASANSISLVSSDIVLRNFAGASPAAGSNNIFIMSIPFTTTTTTTTATATVSPPMSSSSSRSTLLLRQSSLVLDNATLPSTRLVACVLSLAASAVSSSPLSQGEARAATPVFSQIGIISSDLGTAPINRKGNITPRPRCPTAGSCSLVTFLPGSSANVANAASNTNNDNDNDNQRAATLIHIRAANMSLAAANRNGSAFISFGAESLSSRVSFDIAGCNTSGAQVVLGRRDTVGNFSFSYPLLSADNVPPAGGSRWFIGCNNWPKSYDSRLLQVLSGSATVQKVCSPTVSRSAFTQSPTATAEHTATHVATHSRSARMTRTSSASGVASDSVTFSVRTANSTVEPSQSQTLLPSASRSGEGAGGTASETLSRSMNSATLSATRSHLPVCGDLTCIVASHIDVEGDITSTAQLKDGGGAASASSGGSDQSNGAASEKTTAMVRARREAIVDIHLKQRVPSRFTSFLPDPDMQLWTRFMSAPAAPVTAFFAAVQSDPAVAPNGQLSVKSVQRLSARKYRVHVQALGIDEYRDLSFAIVASGATSCIVRDADRLQPDSAVAANSTEIALLTETLTGGLLSANFIRFSASTSFLSAAQFVAAKTTAEVFATFSLLSGSPGSAMAMQRSRAISGMLACGETPNQGLPEQPMDWLTSPLGLAVGQPDKMYSRGTILGNWLIVFAVVVLQLLGALCFDLYYRRKTFFSKKTLGAFVFPGAMWTFITVLVDGIAQSSINLMLYEVRTSQDHSIGGLGLASIVGTFIFFASKLLPVSSFHANVGDRKVVVPMDRRRRIDAFPSKAWSWILGLFIAPYEWYDRSEVAKRDHFCARFGSSFDCRKGPHSSSQYDFLADLLEFADMIGIALVAAAGRFADQGLQCNSLVVLLCALISISWAVSMQGTIAVKFEHWSALASSTILMFQTFFTVLTSYLQSEDMALRMEHAGKTLQVMLIVFVVASGALKFFVWCVESLISRGPRWIANRLADIGGEKRHRFAPRRSMARYLTRFAAEDGGDDATSTALDAHHATIFGAAASDDEEEELAEKRKEQPPGEEPLLSQSDDASWLPTPRSIDVPSAAAAADTRLHVDDDDNSDENQGLEVAAAPATITAAVEFSDEPAPAAASALAVGVSVVSASIITATTATRAASPDDEQVLKFLVGAVEQRRRREILRDESI